MKTRLEKSSMKPLKLVPFELAPFLRLAKSFRKGADKIVAFCKHRITSGKVEGFNNIVSRVVHRACGITNLAYAWLKFRQLSIQPI
jgi:transposase